MKFSAVVLALLVAPVASLSYLDQISKGPASAAPSTGGSEPPFFFTNGPMDEPATPSYSAPAPAASSPAPNTGSYLANLGGSSSNAPSGRGLGGYLDNIAGPGSTSTRGPGLTSYLDALPKGPSMAGGAGISSYAESLNRQGASSAAAAPAPAAPAPAAPAPASSGPGPVSQASTSGYLNALKSASSSAPSGSGMRGYLDALPRAAALVGGAGLQTHVSTLAVNAAPGGPGIQSFTEMLSGGRKPFGKSFAPSGSAYKTSAPAFQMGSITGHFDFSFEASAEIVEQIKAAGNRRVRLSGTVNSVSY